MQIFIQRMERTNLRGQTRKERMINCNSLIITLIITFLKIYINIYKFVLKFLYGITSVATLAFAYSYK